MALRERDARCYPRIGATLSTLGYEGQRQVLAAKNAVKHREISATKSLVHRQVDRACRRVLAVGLTLKTLEQLRLMRRHGFELVHAPDAATALRELHEKRPAIVCVDLTAPLNGHELAQQIRNTAEGLGIVMVGLANKGSPALRRPTADANFNCFLEKPVDIDALIRIGDPLQERS